jgi:hypothetical protein
LPLYEPIKNVRFITGKDLAIKMMGVVSIPSLNQEKPLRGGQIAFLKGAWRRIKMRL